MLFENVASVTVIDCAQLLLIAPPETAELPVKVALSTVATLQLAMAPPSLFSTVLLVNSPPETTSSPQQLQIAPPP